MITSTHLVSLYSLMAMQILTELLKDIAQIHLFVYETNIYISILILYTHIIICMHVWFWPNSTEYGQMKISLTENRKCTCLLLLLLFELPASPRILFGVVLIQLFG